MGNWEGAIDTDEGRAFHRTAGERRAWVAYYGGWCYPTNWCAWCHEQRGDEQVWLPADGTSEHEALVERLAQAMYDGLAQEPVGWPLEDTAVRAVLAALRKEAP